MLYDGPGTLFFLCQRSRRNSSGVTPSRGAKQRWGRLRSAFLTNILEMVQDRDIVTMEQ